MHTDNQSIGDWFHNFNNRIISADYRV